MTEPNDMDVYLAARAEWDDRFAGQRRSVRYMAAVTAGALALAAAGMGFGIYASLEGHFVPYVVAIDKLGQARVAPAPKRVGDWPAPVIRRELADFIRNIRTITPDIDTLRHDQDAAGALIAPNSAAWRKIAVLMRSAGHRPLELAKTETVDVTIASVNFLGGSSWQVQWTESAYSRDTGKLISRGAFTATMVLAFRQPTDRGTLTLNPLGLYITQIDIQQASQ